LSKGFAVAEDTRRGIRRAPVIRVIHHACTTGTHNFSHELIEKHFVDLLELCVCDEGLKKAFTDGGKKKTSLQYIAAVEQGLRNFGLHTTSMGRVAMSSAAAWKATPLAKKRDCYIAVCRYIQQMGSLKPWTSFHWGDFVHLKKLHKTFKIRHWPVSNDEFWKNKKQSIVKAPEAWSVSKVNTCYRRFLTITYRRFHIPCYRCFYTIPYRCFHITCYRRFHTIPYRCFHTICYLQVSKSVSKRKSISKSKSTKESDLAGEKMNPGVITIWDSSDEEGGLIAAPVEEEVTQPPQKRTKRTPVQKRTRSARAASNKQKSEEEESEKEESEEEESEEEESGKEESEKEESEKEESE